MTELSELEAVLRYLRDLEKRCGGYEVFGVRGWAPVSAISEATSIHTVSEELRVCVRRSWVERADVRIPDAQNAFYCYRIATAGARHLAGREGHVGGRDIPPPQRDVQGKRQALLGSGAIAALDALRHAANHAARRERIVGERGWRTSLDLTTWLKAEGDRTGEPRVFFSDELQRLVRYGLVERREGAPGEILYRLTALGAELVPLEWK